MKRFWQLANIIALLSALTANFLVGAQVLDVSSIGEVADVYATYLSPAGYAFSIWSLIYVWLVAFVIYQARDIVRSKDANTLPQEIGPWFVIASIANGLWTYVFAQELIGVSVLLLLLLTASLYILLWRLKVAVVTPTLWTVVGVWWPLMIYAGWVTVASVVNIASWLDSLSLAPTALVASVVLVGLMIALLSLLMLRNMREVILACVWGIVAIGARQWEVASGNSVMVTAFGVAAVLLTAVAFHAYKTRKPFKVS